MSMNKVEINDLRSAIEYLKDIKGQLVKSDVEVNPHGELAGVYRYVGAGGTVKRPTKIGPAMIFNNIKGHKDAKVIIGLLSSRERVGILLGCESKKLGFLLNEAVKNPINPIIIENENAPCQEVVHYATDEEFDIRKILPAPTNTEEDAGPYITLGMCYARDPETGEGDVTIHRLCLQGKDELSMFFTPGVRHLDAFRKKAEESGEPLPISISIGVDPAIEIASCFEPPTTPIGFNELSIAGAIRKKPVEMVKCLTVDEAAIARAEYVIEGELLPNKRVREDMNTNTGKAMQTCIGPSEEHVNMAGIPTEASIIQMVEKAMPGRLVNVYAHPAGGGKYMAILQIKKSMASDQGRERQAALLALSAFSELKTVILVDEDVDPFDSNDVLWALNTRYQGDIDTIFIPGVRCHPLDPSQSPEYSWTIRDRGIACKTIFDCTVPYELKDKFKRAKFTEVDLEKFKIEDYK